MSIPQIATIVPDLKRLVNLRGILLKRLWAIQPGRFNRSVEKKIGCAKAALAARPDRISGLVATWKEIYMNYEILWEKDESLSSTESWKEFEATKRRQASIDETTLPKKSKLIERAYEHVLRKRGLANV